MSTCPNLYSYFNIMLGNLYKLLHEMSNLALLNLNQCKISQWALDKHIICIQLINP